MPNSISDSPKPVVTGEQVTMTARHLEAFGRCSTYSNDVIQIRDIRSLVASIVSGETVNVPLADVRELRNALTDFGSLLYGWHMDGTAWSEWDESVRQRLLHINTTFLWLSTPATQEEK